MANLLTELMELAAGDLTKTPSVFASVTFNYPDKNSYLFTVKGPYGEANVTSLEYPSITVEGTLVYGPIGEGKHALVQFGFAGVLSGSSEDMFIDVEATMQPTQCTLRVVDVKARAGARASFTLASPLTFTPEKIGSPGRPFSPAPTAPGCRFSSSDGSPYVLLTQYSTS